MRSLTITASSCIVDVESIDHEEIATGRVTQRVVFRIAGVEKLRLTGSDAFELAAALLAEAGYEVSIDDVFPPHLRARWPR